LFNFNTKKLQPFVIILIVGILVGIFITTQFINPLLNNTNNNSNCSTHIKTNEILNKENTCLYELLDNSKDISKCVANKSN
jgi:regulatory protein YycI of two-component signal transduction system YycFG